MGTQKRPIIGAIKPEPRLILRDIRARAVILKPRNPVQTAAGILNLTPLVLIDLVTEQE